VAPKKKKKKERKKWRRSVGTGGASVDCTLGSRVVL